MNISQELAESIRAAGQEHLLRFWNDITEDEQRAFAAQLEKIDFSILPGLIRDYEIGRAHV